MRLIALDCARPHRYVGELAWLEVTGSGWLLVPHGQGRGAADAADDDTSAAAAAATHHAAATLAAEAEDATAIAGPAEMAEMAEMAARRGAVSPPSFLSSGGSALHVQIEDAATLPGGARRFEGAWEHGMPHGEGTATYADGAVYVGGMARGARDGEGRMTYADGREHRGGWRADVPHGAGVAVDPSAHVVLDGSWEVGVLTGTCRARYANGDVYEGACEGSAGTCVREGHGRCAYASGEVYEGQWHADAPHGEGRMRSRALLPIAAGEADCALAVPARGVERSADGAAPLLGLAPLRAPSWAPVASAAPPRVLQLRFGLATGARDGAAPRLTVAIAPRLVHVSLGWRDGRAALSIKEASAAAAAAAAAADATAGDAAAGDATPQYSILRDGGDGRAAAVDAEYSGTWVHGVMHGSGVLALLGSGDTIEAPFERGVICGHATLVSGAGPTVEGRMAGLALRGRAIVHQRPTSASDDPAIAVANADDDLTRKWLRRHPPLSTAPLTAPSSTATPLPLRAGRAERVLAGTWFEGDLDAAALEASMRRGGGAVVVRNGHGEAVMANGDRYLGQWVGDAPHGHGSYTYTLAAEVYEGAWVGGLRHGQGELRSTSAADTLDEYIGGWRADRRSGRGVQRFGASGDVLEGTWIEDALEGHGTLVSGRGDRYALPSRSCELAAATDGHRLQSIVVG